MNEEEEQKESEGDYPVKQAAEKIRKAFVTVMEKYIHALKLTSEYSKGILTIVN